MDALVVGELRSVALLNGDERSVCQIGVKRGCRRCNVERDPAHCPQSPSRLSDTFISAQVQAVLTWPQINLFIIQK